MKRKAQKNLLANQSNRQRQLYIRNLQINNPEINYKYKNTMGGYQIALGNRLLNDSAVAIKFNIKPNEYQEIVCKFRAIDYHGVSYFNSIEDIENLIVLLKLLK